MTVIDSSAPIDTIAFLYVCQLDGRIQYISPSPIGSVDVDTSLVNISSLFTDVSAREAEQKRIVTSQLSGQVNEYPVELRTSMKTDSRSLTLYERAASIDGMLVIQGTAVSTLTLDADKPHLREAVDYLARLLAIKSRLLPWSAYPASLERCEETVSLITDIFDTHFRHKPQCDRWTAGPGRQIFSRNVKFFVERNEPVSFILPGFPSKSPYTDMKVLSGLPDKGEELAFKTMVKVAEMIEAVYPPGIRFAIVSDGHVFSNLSKLLRDQRSGCSDE